MKEGERRKERGDIVILKNKFAKLRYERKYVEIALCLLREIIPLEN